MFYKSMIWKIPNNPFVEFNFYSFDLFRVISPIFGLEHPFLSRDATTFPFLDDLLKFIKLDNVLQEHDTENSKQSIDGV